jgi:DNA-binding transcriptional LysR family regulator
VVPRDHLLAGRGTVELAELAATGTFIEMRAESGLRLQVDAAFERAGVARTVAFELSTSDSVVRFVGLGFGAALVPASATATADGVTALPLGDAEARHPISLVHPQSSASIPSARAFVSLLREHLPGGGEDG